jgi:hypothetical protein
MGRWRIEREEEPSAWKGIAAGAIAGLVATAAMTGFQSLWSAASKVMGDGEDEDDVAHTSQGGQKEQQSSDQDESSTVKVAEIVADKILGRTLDESGKKLAGEVVHFAFGAVTGAEYGALAEYVPTTTLGAGMPFGASVWLTADEIALPALGLSKPPTAYPPSLHLYAFSAHLVYGFTLEAVRKLVRRMM